VFGADGICRARCFHCKATVELPIELSKSIETDERLVVRVARRTT
jgi:hypothetical protein